MLESVALRDRTNARQRRAKVSFDVDAESPFIFREPDKARRSLGDLEERRFGPRVGVDRILSLLDTRVLLRSPAVSTPDRPAPDPSSLDW